MFFSENDVSKFYLYYFLAAPSRIYGGQNYVFATLPLQLLVVGGGTSVAPAPLFAVPVSMQLTFLASECP